MQYLIPVLLFAALGVLAGVLLTVCSKVFAVKVDERLEQLQEALPQINCGSCGCSGCNAYAEAILNGGAPLNMCKPGGTQSAAKLGEIMGVETDHPEQEVAFVRCSGNCNVTKHKYVYDGSQSCRASNRYYNGSKICTSGCLGYGDCVEACPNGAISIVDRIAKVDVNKCIGCGLCAKACPNELIVIRRKSQKVDVGCKSTAIGKITHSVCENGCIGCKMCEKKCPNGAITVANNFANIDYSKCDNCGECAKACRLGVIKVMGK